MLKFYLNGAPNPNKVALFLEESGLPYEPVPVDTRKGEQHKPEFLAVNPNAKVPAIVDTDGPGGKEARVFDSGAILLYLGEKTGRLMGSAGEKPELLSWLFFLATGIGPFSGQAVHFQHDRCPERARGLGHRQARIRRLLRWLELGTRSQRGEGRRAADPLGVRGVVEHARHRVGVADQVHQRIEVDDQRADVLDPVQDRLVVDDVIAGRVVPQRAAGEWPRRYPRPRDP